MSRIRPARERKRARRLERGRRVGGRVDRLHRNAGLGLAIVGRRHRQNRTSCSLTPHPGLGIVVVRHVQVDLATCRRAPYSPPSAGGAAPAASRRTAAIVFKGKVVLTIHENHKGFPAGSPGPILLEGTTPDGTWVLYAIDPRGRRRSSRRPDAPRSPVAEGRSTRRRLRLLYSDYRAWCGGRLVMTAGGDRIARHNGSSSPGRRLADPRSSCKDAHRAFGSLACDGTERRRRPVAPRERLERLRPGLWRSGTSASTDRRTRLTHRRRARGRVAAASPARPSTSSGRGSAAMHSATVGSRPAPPLGRAATTATRRGRTPSRAELELRVAR